MKFTTLIKSHSLRLIFVFGCLSITACSAVKPWERGNLARPEMSFVPDSMEQKIKTHVYHSKEASQSASAGAGGGCGCN